MGSEGVLGFTTFLFFAATITFVILFITKECEVCATCATCETCETCETCDVPPTVQEWEESTGPMEGVTTSKCGWDENNDTRDAAWREINSFGSIEDGKKLCLATPDCIGFQWYNDNPRPNCLLFGTPTGQDTTRTDVTAYMLPTTV